MIFPSHTPKPLRNHLALLLFALLLTLAGNAAADACTYREAIMALEQGNALRGMALMRMASRDGDPQAAAYLRDKDFLVRRPVLVQTTPALTTASAGR